MLLHGITIDFDDRRTCGLLPNLCTDWDGRSTELEENEDLINFWESKVKEVLEKTHRVVTGNIDTKSILYSADMDAIEAIREAFKGLELQTIKYDEIIKCENCLQYDYLDDNFHR